ncbi:MAG: hypothetical protein EB119_09985 [Synechococcaceae bacterium WBB_34_004]|nr:hypothetical protein [Synechococcaceae bacterium WBB_34_004]
MQTGGELVKKNKGGRPPLLTKETAAKIISYVSKGLTYEKAGEAVGIAPGTIANWQSKHGWFSEDLKKARRALETSLLESIHQAGEKSWQARAWLAERVFGYAQPSARLEVAGAVAHAHAASPALAQLLAGMNSTKTVDGIVNAPLQLTDRQEGKSSISIGQKKARRVPRYSKRPTPPRPTGHPPAPFTTHNTPQKIATKNKKGSDASTTDTNEHPQEGPQQAA